MRRVFITAFLVASLFLSCEMNQRKVPEGSFYVEDVDEWRKGFNGLKDSILIDYPSQIDLSIEKELDSVYSRRNSNIDSMEIVVYHPVIKSSTIGESEEKNHDQYVDTSQIKANVKVHFSEHQERISEVWWIALDQNKQVRSSQNITALEREINQND